MIQSVLPKTVACPFSVNISNEGECDSHFHAELELVFLLRGSMTYLLGNSRYKLRSKDFILASPYESHSICSVTDDGCYVHILIQETHLRYLFSTSKPVSFDWQESLNNRRNPLYLEIADAVHIIVAARSNSDPIFYAKAYQQILRIMIALSEHCPQRSDSGHGEHRSQNQQQKSCEIMDYITSHFTEDISLNTISQTLYLSPPYISKIFKENFGVGVLEYINRLRVQKATVLLSSSNLYITDISQECGFSTTNTFGRIFQKETGLTPTDYRRQHTDEGKSVPSLFPESKQEYLPLLDIVSEDDYYSTSQEKESDVSVLFDFTQQHTARNPRPWNKVLYAGTAHLLLHRSTQDTVLRAINDFDVEYVRFVAPFADTIQSYDEDTAGNPRYFWGLLDEVLHFVVDSKVKPFIVLNYMPHKLAAYDTPSPFNWDANTAPPKSAEKWSAYLTNFFKHIIHMFSYEEVCTWRFEFWNDPAMDGVFWHESMESFCSFFMTSYRAFRAALPDGLFGTPSFMYYDEYRHAEDFLAFCGKQGVKFDFLCLHMYELTDPRNVGNENMNRFIEHQISQHHGVEFVSEAFRAFQAVAGRTGYGDVPVFITEWNVSPYPEDLSRDTAFMASYIMETIEHLPEDAASISFWSLMDYTSDFVLNQSVFNGGLGLLSIGNLPKSSYLAFMLLKQMHGEILESGDGYCITRSKYGCHICMHNYSFYNEDYLSGASRPLSQKDRYQIFNNCPPKNFYLNLALRPGRYRIERLILDREHGSIYDGWIHMGAPEFIDKACLGYLNKIAYPEMNIQYKNIQGRLIFSEQVPLHGVLLLNLIRLGDR